MPVGAANALLKTLEEPLGDVIIFLVANCMDQLPATIVSRCQQMHFYAKASSETVSWLRGELKTQDNIATLLSIADGAPLTVKRLIEADYLSLRNAVVKHLLAIITGNANPIAPLPDWLKWGDELVFYALTSLALDVSRVQMGSQQGLMNTDCNELLEKIAALISPVLLQEWMIMLLEKKRFVARGMNLNSQLLFESLLLGWGVGV